MTATVTTPFDVAERRIWSGKAEAYADTYARLCAHPAAALLDAAEVGPGSRVLDVGCGSGTVSAEAVARGASAYAVDAEPGMAAATRRAVPGVGTHIARLPELPYADDTFDAVVGNFVLNHVGRPRAALTELRRITRPGMLRGMAPERVLTEEELDARPGEYEDHLQAIAEQWYQTGMGHADKGMGQ
ncbi:class I SAM-dependent methyltransferase [Streptomyces sp. NPDC058576]|uniref:class I SAM-dependent methyltransferase n=1 Tax=Streptomyces sp. NPDC058576 TaxID=3346547 RepID=UPI00364949E7